MTPVVASLATTIPDPVHVQAMWWALAIGAGFGGNMTAVGASANVVMLGIGAREGYPIGFWEFTRKGAVVMALTIARVRPVSVVALLRFRLGVLGEKRRNSGQATARL